MKILKGIIEKPKTFSVAVDSWARVNHDLGFYKGLSLGLLLYLFTRFAVDWLGVIFK